MEPQNITTPTRSHKLFWFLGLVISLVLVMIAVVIYDLARKQTVSTPADYVNPFTTSQSQYQNPFPDPTATDGQTNTNPFDSSQTSTDSGYINPFAGGQ